MDIATISMPENDADEIYQTYLEAVKTRKEKYLEDLKKVYHALKNGKKVVDIFEAFKITGINEKNEPKLAIAPANLKTVFFFKQSNGAGMFAKENSRWSRDSVGNVELPNATFGEHWASDEKNNILNDNLQTNVPMVPAHLLPAGSLGNFHILWEVNEWLPIAKAVDPFLLKRINLNTFIVLAEWDLTEVEQIVMRGR